MSLICNKSHGSRLHIETISILTMKPLHSSFLFLFVGGGGISPLQVCMAQEYRGDPCNIVTSDDPLLPKDGAYCGFYQVPLNYEDDDDDRTIELFVKTVPPLDQSTPPTSRVLLIEGGPGQSGVGLEEAVPQIRQEMPNTIILIPDARGVARSTPIMCDDFNELNSGGYLYVPPESGEEMWGRCLDQIKNENGDGYLGYFTVTAAAKDLHSLIQQTQEEYPDNKPLVYSVSYGTLVMQRFFTLFGTSTPVAGAILDGVLAPGYGQFVVDTKDQQANIVAGATLDACGKLSNSCRLALSSTPATAAMDFLRLAEYELLCPAFQELFDAGTFTIDLFKENFANLGSQVKMRPLLAPLLYRMLRCTEEDVAQFMLALQRVQVVLASESEMTSDPNLLQNVVLQSNIVLSENYSKKGKSVEEAVAENYAYFATTFAAVKGTKLHAIWEANDALYTPGPEAFQHATETPPIMAVHGTLDPATPFALLHPWMQRHYGQFVKHFVRVEMGVHAMGNGGNECVMSIQTQFLNDPDQETLDMSCLDMIESRIADFEGNNQDTQDFASAVFDGTSGLWPDPLTPLVPMLFQSSFSSPAEVAAGTENVECSQASVTSDQLARLFLLVFSVSNIMSLL